MFPLYVKKFTYYDRYNILGLKFKIWHKQPYIRDIYANKQMHKAQAGNKLIIDKIKSDKPFVLIRFGMSEANILADNYLHNFTPKYHPDSVRTFKENAGFFSASEEQIDKYVKLILNLLPNADIISTWIYDLPLEETLIRDFAKQAQICTMDCINENLFFYDDPWTGYLEGKKVLIVHPFAASIKEQHKKLDSLFANKKLAPKYDLQIVPAIQSIGLSDDSPIFSKFKDWFEALEYMYEQIDKKDYDIAIVGAGAYGMPIANHIKEQGKQAIQMCGATQLLFGIKGSRWDNNEKFSKEIYNSNWIRALPEDQVPNLDKFRANEGGNAYW